MHGVHNLRDQYKCQQTFEAHIIQKKSPKRRKRIQFLTWKCERTLKVCLGEGLLHQILSQPLWCPHKILGDKSNNNLDVKILCLKIDLISSYNSHLVSPPLPSWQSCLAFATALPQNFGSLGPDREGIRGK